MSDAGVDGLNLQKLWESTSVTEFQLAEAAMRPVAAAHGAANPVDPFSMAIDAVMGHFAYGSSYDSAQEVFYFQMPAGA
eukprot:6240047-Amphidinium_carterae.1